MYRMTSKVYSLLDTVSWGILYSVSGGSLDSPVCVRTASYHTGY